MSKLMALITTFVLGTSSVAAADTFSVSARAQVSFGTATSVRTPVIRDHRTPTRVASQEGRWNHNRPDYNRPDYNRPAPTNWFDTLAWMDQGYRSAVSPTYIQPTAEVQSGYLRLESSAGRPTLSRISIRYFGGAREEIEASSLRITSQGVIIPFNSKTTAVHQIVFYPAVGSSGSFHAEIAAK